MGFDVMNSERVHPDIIARKDGKFYAIEIEFNKPNYKKYDGITLFDKVEWILKNRIYPL